MAVWRPSSTIRVKVIGLAWRGDELLLSEVEDSSGRVKGLRALGGSIEFGETREQAIRREFRDELGCEVTLHGGWHSFENIYEHEGAIGHEFIFAVNVELGDPSLYARERIRFVEDGGAECWARWALPTRLPEDVALYPTGLLARIEDGSVGPAPR